MLGISNSKCSPVHESSISVPQGTLKKGDTKGDRAGKWGESCEILTSELA